MTTAPLGTVRPAAAEQGSRDVGRSLVDTHVCGPAGTEADRGASSRRYGDETVVDQGMVPWGRPPEQVPGRRLTALLPSLVELYLRCMIGRSY